MTQSSLYDGALGKWTLAGEDKWNELLMSTGLFFTKRIEDEGLHPKR